MTNKADVILDSPLKTFEKLQQNRKQLGILIGAVVLVVLGIFGYNYYMTQRNNEGQAVLSSGVFKFEKNQWEESLKVFDKVTRDFNGTNASNLAHLYAGISSLRLSKYDQAIQHFKDFSSSDLLIQACAYSLLGDAYMEKKSYSDAVSFYEKAYNYKTNSYVSPNYLLKLGLAYEANKEIEKAKQSYQKLIDAHPQALEISNAKRYKAQLDGVE